MICPKCSNKLEEMILMFFDNSPVIKLMCPKCGYMPIQMCVCCGEEIIDNIDGCVCNKCLQLL